MKGWLPSQNDFQLDSSIVTYLTYRVKCFYDFLRTHPSQEIGQKRRT
jgi:hypothetical protein